MRRYEIETYQRLNEMGRVGIWLLMLSPLAGGASYYWFLVQITKRYGSGSTGLPALCMVACGLAFIGGAILLLIGREYHHSARELDDEGKKGGLWANSG
jgi:hypothetical protein